MKPVSEISVACLIQDSVPSGNACEVPEVISTLLPLATSSPACSSNLPERSPGVAKTSESVILPGTASTPRMPGDCVMLLERVVGGAVAGAERERLQCPWCGAGGAAGGRSLRFLFRAF